MCVDLGRRDVGVTEHRLHRTEVRSALDEMRRERVPELVGGDVAGRQAHTGAPRVVA